MNAATRPNANDFDSFEDYCDALRAQKWLTPGEYACLLSEELAWGEENQAEIVAQYRSECAMFGDAGPGQGIAVRDGAKRIAFLKDQIARLKRISANLAAA